MTGRLERSEVWPLGGYAPGNYMCKCQRCEEMFQGDKRALRCLECAVLQTKEGLAVLRTELAEARKSVAELTTTVETQAWVFARHMDGEG